MKRRVLLRLSLGVVAVLTAGLLIPERAVIPVEGATPRDWNAKSFWYEPWGISGVHKGIDIFDSFTPKEMLTVRRLFEKRNTFEHNRGEISEMYVKRIPEDKKLVGTTAQLSWEELLNASHILRVALDRLPLPPK